MTSRVLVIEAKRSNNASFVSSLRKKEYQIETVSTGSEAVERLLDIDPDLIIVNAASMRTSGKKICRDLRSKAGNLPVVLIVENEQDVPDETCANAVLHLPFTARKLLNRITPLLPSKDEPVLHVGVLRLEAARKKVRCQGREARLTPRLTSLLQILMEHAGEVIQREQLFKEAWNTDYTGDTRTLDVHISWLRQAIEEDPRKPVFLKTIRGIGYRLDV